MFTISRLIAPTAPVDGAPTLVGRLALDEGHGRFVRATLRYSALGIVEAVLNGTRVSDELLTPGWSSYEWRLRVAETDVTALVAARSTLELTLGNGWYRGSLTWMGATAVYGDELAAIAEIHLLFEDGHAQVWGTDERWTVRAGGILSDDLYHGQTIDARRRGSDSPEQAVRIVDEPGDRFEPYVGPPVVPLQTLGVKDAWTSSSGRIIVDFGENLVGWVRARVSGDPGDIVTLRHAEVLEDGEIGIRPLRSARATDRFILSGGDDVFEPRFTFHGFRYVEVDGWPGGLDAVRRGGVEAVRIGSRLRRTGTFSSSEPLLDRLHQNVVNSTLGNFVDLPTDCPQRDERLGWTGDIAVFAATSAYLFDVEDFLRDWLRDVTAEQEHQGGVVPYVVPDVLKHVGVPEDIAPVDSTAVWSDAIVWVPWAVWMASGDTRVLVENFEGMLAHLRHVDALVSASGLWDRGFQFGDWLDPDAPPDRPADAKADRGLVATASLYRSADLTFRIAGVLGRTEVRDELGVLRDRTRAAFRDAYVDRGARRLRNHCETSYALAIVFGLFDDDERTWAGANLADLVVASGHRISTGFAGTPYILDALSGTGHVDVAGRLLLQRECPSWLYPVTMGATTIWERWDSMLPDGSINPGEMTSFNHYALGAVADWMHRVLGGLTPVEPGYSRVRIAPQPIDGVDHAQTSFDSRHGRVAVSWHREGTVVHLVATVPEGVVAEIRVGDIAEEVGAGDHRFSAEVAPAATA
ncbi:MAG: alpha-L-rhamnosidase [Microbacterium sp. SCN 71-17]|uniref:alpha-L-rhamnosidase n=1 Tax=Microbacterium sp. SCN 71-17 TaxID=1660111 RepID=UPI00086BF2DC|nr:alpha-L-rhamnosidase [Microbacterium sp. SCN 71-17]ODT41349.1 MAG: alpha-L-rhamnosidase [Microbacterium sp. SCN 71-17]